MIEVKITVIPFGDRSKKEVVDTITIANDLTHPERPLLGNYKVKSKKYGEFEIRGFCRQEGIGNLVALVTREWQKVKNVRFWPGEGEEKDE